MAFIKLNRVARDNTTKEVVLDTTNIARVCERKESDTYLYDSEGNVVETREGATYYIVESKNGHNTRLDKENYDLLVKALGC